VRHAIARPSLYSLATGGSQGLRHRLVRAEALTGKGQHLCEILVVFLHASNFTTILHDLCKNIFCHLHKILLHYAMIRFTNNQPRKVNSMQDDFYITVNDGNAVIISPNEEYISMGVHIRGGSVRIDMTPQQAQELIEAIANTMNTKETA